MATNTGNNANPVAITAQWQSIVPQEERDKYIQQLTNSLTLLSNGLAEDQVWRVASGFETTAFTTSLTKEAYIQRLAQKLNLIRQKIKKATEAKAIGSPSSATAGNVPSPSTQVEQVLAASPAATGATNDMAKLAPQTTASTAIAVEIPSATAPTGNVTIQPAQPSAANISQLSMQQPPLAINSNAQNTYAQVYKTLLSQRPKPQILTNLTPEADAEIREQTRQMTQVYQSLDLLIPHYIATTQTPMEIPRFINMQILLREHMEAQPKHTLTLETLRQLRILLLRYIGQVHQTIARQWGQPSAPDLTAISALNSNNSIISKIPAVAATATGRPVTATPVINPAPTRTTPAELDAVMEGVIKSPLDPKNLRLPPRKSKSTTDRKERANPVDYLVSLIKRAEKKRQLSNRVDTIPNSWQTASDGMTAEHPLFLDTTTIDLSLINYPQEYSL
ncbi:hypothetical protein BDF19DRAFT_414026 [Syncephalis fuscata]|nr:hypothetical protein BDF19DRAFT_414026 [Syncephalis fuscata]